MTRVTWEQYKEAVLMSEQTTGTDQETGAPPPDPNTPAQSSEVHTEAQQQGQSQPKSPDEDPGDEAREGGTATHPRREQGSVEEDEDEDN